MDIKYIMKYTMELNYAKKLLVEGLITEEEYEKIEKQIRKDYGIISNLTT